MNLTEYHYEILNILDEKYPKQIRKSSLLALLADKNPKKFEREIKYLGEYKFIEKVELGISLPAFIGAIPIDIPMGYKITAYGIDELKRNKSKKTYLKKRKKVNRPIAFISASFNDNVNQLIKWVRNRADNAGINTLWLKEIYKARPTIDKIDQAINESDCIIQIITSEVIANSGEIGWIGNEMGMAYKCKPGSNIAVFVEKGISISGIGKSLTDLFPIDRKKLPQDEKKAEKYLTDLKNKINISS